MRADEIKDRGSFEAWLNARPATKLEQEDIILAHRTAMRVLPIIISDSQQMKLTTKAELIDVLWSSMVSRVASRQLTDEIQKAAHHIEQTTSRRYAGRASKRAIFAALYAVRSEHAADVQSVFVIDAAEEAAVGAATEPILRSSHNSKLGTVDTSDAASSAAYTAVHDPKLPREYVLAAAVASKSIWDEIRMDAAWLETASRNSSLLDRPLWSKAPMWWEARSSKFLSGLQLSNLAIDQFDVWASWYSHTSNGTGIFGISSVEVRHDLERNIALGSTNGTFNQAFWKREPKEINADIARWVEEAQQAHTGVVRSNEVVLSSAPQDAQSALEIAPVLAELGYRPRTPSEIAQRSSAFVGRIDHFPPRFVALLSESYISSRESIDEWNLAKSKYLTIQPSRFVPVLVKPVILPAALRSLAPIPLYDRSAEEALEDLRRALSFDPVFLSAQQARQVARGVATHRAIRNEKLQWDVERTPDDLKPFLDSDILKLPKIVEKLAEILIMSLGHQNSNAPGFVVEYLKQCVSELKDNGPAFDASDVKSWVNLFELEVSSCADEGWVQKHRNPIKEFLAQHSKLVQHYPAILRREYLALQSPIDPDVFDDPEFADRLAKLRGAAVSARQRGEVTEQFLLQVEDTYKKLNALVLFGQTAPGHKERLLSNTGEIPLPVLRKKEAFEKGGTMDRIGSDMGEIAKGAAGEVVGALVMEALKGIGKLIFNSG